MVSTISPQQLAELLASNKPFKLIDVRTPAEFGEVHVTSARNLPLDRLDPAAVAAEAGSEGPIYFICKSGGRSGKACEKLIASGFSDVISVDGGTTACEAAGLPVVRGRKAMSLERQVRIAAGAIVFGGVMLAAFANNDMLEKIGLGIAGFVGAGLVFAGITDTCGMAMLIARMPWNQVSGSATSCSRALLLAAMLTATAGPALAASPTRDSLPAVQQAVAEQKAVIIDVREPDEWAESHLSGARLVPLSRLKAGVAPADLARVLPQDKIIYCHCLAGGRCLLAADILKPLGYDVRPLGQSYDELVAAGFPAVTGR
jgi:rhodanese-related sulfurtransferase